MRTWLPFTHRLWLLQAPDDPPGGGGNPPAGDGNPPNGEGEKKTYTQAELNELFAQRAKSAASKREKDLLEALGVTDVDAAKSLLAKAREAENAQATDLQKAQKLAADEKARADRAEAEKKAAEQKALETALRSALTTEALKQGIDEGELTSVWREFRDSQELRGKVEADDDDNFTGLDKAVQEIVKAHPRWLKDGAAPGPRKVNTNATNRGKQEEPTSDELVRRKRRSSMYSGI